MVKRTLRIPKPNSHSLNEQFVWCWRSHTPLGSDVLVGIGWTNTAWARMAIDLTQDDDGCMKWVICLVLTLLHSARLLRFSRSWLNQYGLNQNGYGFELRCWRMWLFPNLDQSLYYWIAFDLKPTESPVEHPGSDSETGWAPKRGCQELFPKPLVL